MIDRLIFDELTYISMADAVAAHIYQRSISRASPEQVGSAAESSQTCGSSKCILSRNSSPPATRAADDSVPFCDALSIVITNL
jgi:hypothetical protein